MFSQRVKLVKGHIHVWFVGDERSINGCMSDTVTPCVPELDHCEINVHLDDVRLIDMSRYDVLIIDVKEVRRRV